MIEALRILHFLALAAGIGGGLASMLAARQGADPASGPEARAALGRLRLRLSRVTAGAVALLWLSGIALVHAGWTGWGALPGLFWAKLAFVAALTAITLRAQQLVLRAGRSGTPPPAPAMARLGQGAMGSALAALVLAVVAFTL
jgi:hypothetical protein